MPTLLPSAISQVSAHIFLISQRRITMTEIGKQFSMNNVILCVTKHHCIVGHHESLPCSQRKSKLSDAFSLGESWSWADMSSVTKEDSSTAQMELKRLPVVSNSVSKLGLLKDESQKLASNVNMRTKGL